MKREIKLMVDIDAKLLAASDKHARSIGMTFDGYVAQLLDTEAEKSVALRKAGMVPVPLTADELKEFVGSLTDDIETNGLPDPKEPRSPAQVVRDWKAARRSFIAWGLKSKVPFARPTLKDMRAEFDTKAALIERLCPLLEAAA